MKRRRSIALTLAILRAGVSPAARVWAKGAAQEGSAYEGDVFRFCRGDIPFVSEIEACLETNISRLSRRCRQEFLPTHHSRLQEEHFY